LDPDSLILLMVQKSSDHLLRLGIYPIIYRVLYIHPRWLFGISEPSTPTVEVGNLSHYLETQMSLVLIGKDLFFGGKTKDKWVPGICIVGFYTSQWLAAFLNHEHYDHHF